MNKKQIQKDIDYILVNKIGKDSETGRYMVANVEIANKDRVELKFDGGIPNLTVLYHLMDYFSVGIENIHMDGDGEDFWYSEMTGGHDSWINVVIRLDGKS